MLSPDALGWALGSALGLGFLSTTERYLFPAREMIGVLWEEVRRKAHGSEERIRNLRARIEGVPGAVHLHVVMESSISLSAADSMRQVRLMRMAGRDGLGELAYLGALWWSVRDMAALDAIRVLLNKPEQDRTQCLLEAAEAGLCALGELEDRVLALARPVARWDDHGRVHRADGPAVVWPDGKRGYFWHGVEVPRWVVVHPEQITLEAIGRQADVEVRRAMIERYGLDRFVREAGAHLVHANARGRLWSLRMGGAARMRVVEVTCPSTGRIYFLPVPPGVRKADEAIAWTFGLSSEEYRPEVET